MKAVILSEFGGPEKLEIRDIVNPDPSPGEVRLRVRAIGLNRAEVAARVGKYPLPQALPIRLGYEGAGVVDAVGAGVTNFKVGDRAAVVPIRYDFAVRGTYAEFCNVPEALLTPTPADFTDEEAAATWMAYLTVWSAIIVEAKARPGDFVLVTAASSSLGAPAFQLLRAEGMISIATTRTTSKVSRIQALGADFVIDTSSENLLERITEITKGHGIDVAFDAVGGPQVKELAKAMAPRGVLVLYGMLDSRPLEITPMHLMPKQLTVIGHMVFACLDDPEVRRQGVDYVQRHIRSGAFRPVISRTFSFDIIADAQSYMQSNEQVGKIVVTVP